MIDMWRMKIEQRTWGLGFESQLKGSGRNRWQTSVMTGILRNAQSAPYNNVVESDDKLNKGSRKAGDTTEAWCSCRWLALWE